MATNTTMIAGRYRLERRLGVGGMSTVQLAFDERLERPVAIKLLAEHLADDPTFVSRFRREALAAARLVHPNIVQVFDFGFDDSQHQHFIVMEHVPGYSCAELLRDRGRMEIEQAVEIVSQGCRGLDYAHRNGVVHRDVKPGNLLVSEAEVVKLADFGIARATDQSSITQVGSVLGTAAYLAPEQARGEEAGPQADLYSLGVVAYQLLSGRLPYEATSLSELALKQQREAPLPLDHLNRDVPAELARAVAMALALDKAHRPSDAMAFAEALRAGAHGIARAATDVQTSQLGTKAATRILDRRRDPTAATRVARREPPAQDRGSTRVPAREASHQPVQQPPRQPVQQPSRQPVQQPRRRAVADEYVAPPPRRRGRAARRFTLFLLLLAVFVAAVIIAVVIATSTSSTAVHFRNDVQGVLNQLQQLIHQYTK